MSTHFSAALEPLLPADLEALLRLGFLRGFEAGEVLYTPGEPLEHAYLITQGRLGLAAPDGAGRIVLGPGHALGAEALRDAASTAHRVTAETDATAVVITGGDAAWLAENEPELAARLFLRLTLTLAGAPPAGETAPRRRAAAPDSARRFPLLSDLAERVHHAREKMLALGEPPPETPSEWAAASLPAVRADLDELIAAARETLAATPADERPELRRAIRRLLAPITQGSLLTERFSDRRGGEDPGFRVFNLIYRETAEGADVPGLLWDAYAHAQRFAIGLRERRHVMAARLATEVRDRTQGGRRVRVLTLGCGPARSLADLLEQPGVADRVALVCLDDDQEAIVHANNLLKQRAPRGDIVFRQSRPADLNPDIPGFGGFDVVASLYVTNSVESVELSAVLVTAYKWLNPGGALLLAALSDRDPDHFLLETVFTWEPTHYEQRLLQDLLIRSPFPGDQAAVETSESGLNLFVHAVKR